ncbi:MAG: 4Fe-4S binding protein [Candidatus Aenigmarchaeota archaeon]|nr:4Fe-4S binding protein [Candidatus Aenigmarchaeota archaeon]
MKNDSEIMRLKQEEPQKAVHKFRRIFKPIVDAKAEQCPEVVAFCPHGAISMDGKLKIDYNLCDGCLICLRECHTGAIKEVKEE